MRTALGTVRKTGVPIPGLTGYLWSEEYRIVVTMLDGFDVGVNEDDAYWIGDVKISFEKIREAINTGIPLAKIKGLNQYHLQLRFNRLANKKK